MCVCETEKDEGDEVGLRLENGKFEAGEPAGDRLRNKAASSEPELKGR